MRLVRTAWSTARCRMQTCRRGTQAIVNAALLSCKIGARGSRSLLHALLRTLTTAGFGAEGVDSLARGGMILQHVFNALVGAACRRGHR